MKTCILLVNLGTPDAPTPGAVGRYLREFLGDGRVIDFPWLPRKLLVNGIIAPIRRFKSAKEYQKVWTPEGSPLLLYGEALQAQLQARLSTEDATRDFGGEVTVELAMRYQHPSMDMVLARIEKARYDRICILPLYAQYASATTGSTLEKAFNIMAKWYVIPDVVAISQYWDFPGYLNGFVEQARSMDPKAYDQVLFSYHGLPERQVDKVYEDRKCPGRSLPNWVCPKTPTRCASKAGSTASGSNPSATRSSSTWRSKGTRNCSCSARHSWPIASKR